MSQALSTAASGIVAQDVLMVTLSHNLSHTSTVGFKRQAPVLEGLLYLNKPFRIAENIEPTMNAQIDLGIRVAVIDSVLTQGALDDMSEKLILAVQGNGFFALEFPDGQRRYTRSGLFFKNAKGQITTVNDCLLSPEIVVADDANVIISRQGGMQALFSDDIEAGSLGQIELARFANERVLEKVASNMLKETVSSGLSMLSNLGEDSSDLIHQSYVEISNVEPVSEMIFLIKAERMYEMLKKIMHVISENWKNLNNVSSSV